MCILWISLATLTEVFPCFSLSCKANARVWLAKTRHGQYSPKFVICVVLFVIRVVLFLIVIFYVLFMCKCVLPLGVNPNAVDKYINININIPVAAPSKVPLLGLRVRIPPGAWMPVSCECSVLSDRGLCDGLIPRPEESYRVCVWACHWEWSGARVTLYT
jgi:hypothetical protein